MVLLFSDLETTKIGQITVPPAKVFVVELTTALVQLPNNQKVKLTYFVDDGFTMAGHFFAPTFVGTDFTETS